MNTNKPADWNPRSQDVLDDQIAAYDAMRKRCPVAHSDYLWWSLFRHEDVMRVLQDHETFSNAASNHLSIPNAMDPPEHTPYRKIVERYFGAEQMAAFEPVCQVIAETLIGDQRRGEAFELMTRFAQPFALRIQCAFMGWPDTLHEPLREWIGKSHRATRAGDRAAMAQIAVEFDGHIKRQLVVRRNAGVQAADDEILRLHAPLIANRRVTTRPVEIGGRKLDAGERLTLIWAAANRDDAVFGDPDGFDPQHNRDNNLLYGAGVHVCPEAPLARLELRLLMQALLAGTSDVSLVSNPPPELAAFPASGFSSLQVRLHQRSLKVRHPPVSDFAVG